MIIFDSSPLIHLTKIGKLEFIIQLFKILHISNGVYREVVENGREKGYADAEIIQSYIDEKKILVIPLQSEAKHLKSYLHQGEYESILLAKESNALLVIDERKAHKVAEQFYITTISTSGLLLLILKEHIITYPLYESNFSKYAANGWISLDVYQKYLHEGSKQKIAGDINE